MKHLVFALAICGVCASPTPAADRGALRIVFIDVEGGAATLIVTPEGHSLLIDTGWPAALSGGGKPAAAGSGTSAQRIVAAAKREGLSRIDHLLLTHYHADHLGGARELIGAFPIGAFVDHGPNRQPAVGDPPANRSGYQPAELYAGYVAAIAGKPHRVMRPGHVLTIDGLSVTAIDSDGAILNRSLPGAGGPGVGCAAATRGTDIGTDENPRSLGTLLAWGKARILALGDTTRIIEDRLVCPRDLIGPVDLMIADNHGTDNAGSPLLLDTVKPSVIVFNNGAAKGADQASLAFAKAAPYVRGIWQVHFATRSPGDNARAGQIANPDGADAMHPLRLAIGRDGAIAVTNMRTGLTTHYPKAAARPSR
ncbi:MBL fold metallo-hydrolase [Sphingomonas sp. BIUV-7]|uniref:MBL fold metallo-hydrolase n=1 Tax=Sphingomonas natans TaxID=3063330 RepID=A0ABT8YB03_9SPHN|nr:MBL fold metallo-hydrolase [Sphingomonas sp. BIUV-7]MDO6415018.1 MBL fold metallo-hydrolase [Sphingomonas sp. BIUV-7]